MNKTIFYFDRVNSTNDEAKKLVENHKVMSGLVISDHQKKGRGRFGNNWVSMKGNFMGSTFFSVRNYNSINRLQYKVLKIILNLFVKITKKNTTYIQICRFAVHLCVFNVFSVISEKTLGNPENCKYIIFE